MNQTTKNSIFCDNHTSKQALVMKYDQSGVIQFECLKCLCNDQSQRSFIYLEDLIEQQNDQMIDNWPLLNNQSLFKQFQEIKNKQQQQSILQNFIHQMEQLEIQVIERFAEYKKTFINKFECMNGDQVIQKWNEISQVGQFKQMFQRPNIDRTHIQQFLSDQINKIQSNSELIQNEINIYQNQKPQNLDQLNILCKNIHFEFDNLSKKEQITDIQVLINQQNEQKSIQKYNEQQIEILIIQQNQKEETIQQLEEKLRSLTKNLEENQDQYQNQALFYQKQIVDITNQKEEQLKLLLLQQKIKLENLIQNALYSQNNSYINTNLSFLQNYLNFENQEIKSIQIQIQKRNFMDSLLKTYDEHIIIIKGIDLSTLQTNDYKEFIKSIKTCQQTNGWWISVEYSFNLKDIKISQDNNFSKFGEKNIMKTLYKKENETGDQKSKRKSQNLELRNRLTFIKWLHDFLNQNK
ncbi:hypothetical protein ABPG73_006721 [Tetrahymena malaccensis]